MATPRRPAATQVRPYARSGGSEYRHHRYGGYGHRRLRIADVLVGDDVHDVACRDAGRQAREIDGIAGHRVDLSAVTQDEGEFRVAHPGFAGLEESIGEPRRDPRRAFRDAAPRHRYRSIYRGRPSGHAPQTALPRPGFLDVDPIDGAPVVQDDLARSIRQPSVGRRRHRLDLREEPRADDRGLGMGSDEQDRIARASRPGR